MTTGGPDPMPRPNLLLIMTDQQRWDTLGAAGNSVIRTPNLDRLARQGVLFNHAFSPAPICAPARAALLTGSAPSRLRFTANEGRLLDQSDTLATRLNQAGYFTQALGKMHFPQADGRHDRPRSATYGFKHLVLSEETRWARQAGCLEEVDFDDYDRYLLERGLWGWGTPPEIGYNEIKPVLSALPEEHGVTAWLGRQTVDWLRQAPAQPFFLFTSFVKPHAPYDPPEDWANSYDPAAVPPPVRTRAELGRENPYYGEERRWREWDLYSEHAEQLSRAYYYANISLIDKYVGQILDELEAQGLRENTYIVFTSDHGEMAGDHWAWFKSLAYDGSARVPLIVAGPGLPAGEQVSDSVVSLLDVYGTLLACAGLSLPGDRPARDLRDFVHAERPARSELAVVEVGKPGQRCRAARTLDWLYVHWENGGFEELYDLRQDPFQLHDLAREPHYAAKRAMLRTTLVDWLRAWGDPAWELDERGDLLEHSYRPSRPGRWLPRPHGRTPFESQVPPRLWPGGGDKALWWWRAIDGDYSRLLDLARAARSHEDPEA
jgi:arylsulfatase A-like enzyme